MARRTKRRNQPVRLQPHEIEKMRVVGRFAAGLLAQVEGLIKPGISTEEIDRFVDAETRKRGAISAPLGYPKGSAHPFPKHCCTSINHIVCHGIPSANDVLREGDIVNVDVTPIIDGYYGDTSRTFCVGAVDPEVQRLVDDTYEAMRIGIAQVKPGGHVGDIGHAIQRFAEGRGHGVVRQFAGHGIGTIFHGPPTISHVGRRGEGELFEPGMTFTVEPMINLGDWRCQILADHWTVVTVDGSLSAQFEHTVTVTEDGVEVLTLAEGATFDLNSDSA
ncbi:MAG: type I methionyl aminopeptidase [Planctomycetota bacterium]|nr:type I methionyl aminopeptidase [Planctomycetota bacterium]